MFELLSEQDKNNITEWIRNYGPMNGGGYSAPKCSMADLQHILRHWDNAKKNVLGNVFGEQLILSRPYVYHTPTDDIWRKISKVMNNNGAFMRIHTFVNDVCRRIAVLNELRYGLWELCDYYTLAKNDCTRVFDGLNNHTSAFYIDLPNGKKYKVQRSMKPLKVLYKLMETWGAHCDYDEHQWRKDYEEVRILLSQCTNTAELHGTLCLSIHPLDYMTMSDNENDWSSCMRWRHNGEYSQGTIEMMNSSTVVVAYLHNPNKPMTLPNGNTWNNKIWRQLFVVDPNFITEVKPYPYDDENITMTCLDWLKDLISKVNPTACFEHYTIAGDGYDLEISDNEKYNFTFSTGYMYSDFGTMSRDHNVYINLIYWRQNKPNHVWSYCNTTNSTKFFEIEYSGPSECMWCGEYINSDDYDSEEVTGWRVCNDCYGFTTYCSCCGRRVYDDDYYYDNEGNPICEYCHDEYYDYDTITGECCHNDDMYYIYLAKGMEENDKPHFLISCSIKLSTATTNNLSYYSNYFNVNDIRRYQDKDFPWDNKYYLFVDDCTEKGLDLFNYDPEYDT